jgi:hypothetical protein
MNELYKCQPCPNTNRTARGFLTDRGTERAGDESADFASKETSSGWADFLGPALPNTDETHCAASDCAAA